MKNLQKVKSVQRYFYKKTVKFTWNNGFLKLVFSGFIAIQNLKIIFLAYAGRVFVHLTEKNKSFERFKYFRYFRVSVLSYRANSKRRKWRKMYKTSFQWHISECDVIWSNRTDRSDEKLLKSWIWSESFSAENSKFFVAN